MSLLPRTFVPPTKTHLMWASWAEQAPPRDLAAALPVSQDLSKIRRSLHEVGLYGSGGGWAVVRVDGWSGSPPYWSVGAAAKCEGQPWSVHWMKIVGLEMNDWSALVDPIPARPQPSIPQTSLHLETFFPRHITRTSLPPPFSSPWPTLEPKQRPRGRSHRRRQIIKVLILRSAKGQLPLTLAGNRPQGIRPRKGSSRKRVTRRAERNRLRLTTPRETPPLQVCPLSFVLYGSRAKLGHGIHRNNQRLSRAEVASASTQSNTHSRQTQTQTQTQTRSDDGHPLRALPDTHLASQRLLPILIVLANLDPFCRTRGRRRGG